LSVYHFQARSRSPQKMFLDSALGFDFVVAFAAVRTTEVGHPAVHAMTVGAAVASHSDMTVPDPARLSRLADSTPPAPPRLASYCAITPRKSFMRIS
jgi:hypothetical protein